MKIDRKVGDALARAQSAITLWDARDTRMRAEQRAWQLEAQGPRRKLEEDIAVTDCATQVDKLADEVSRTDLLISCAAQTEQDRPAAQAVEDACYYWLDEVIQRHSRRNRGPFKWEVAHMAGLRGWVAATILLNPHDPAFPWDVRLLDPLTVYPDRDDGEPELIVHRYQVTSRQLEAYWGASTVKAALRDHAWGVPRGLGDVPLTCHAFYTKTELAVAIEGAGWLKKPQAHEYGFNPLLLGIGPGAWWRATDDSSGDEYQTYVGTGFLRTVIPNVTSKRQILMMLRRIFSKQAAPPTFASLTDPEATAEDVPTEPGEVAVGRPGDSINTVLPPPLSLQTATALLAALDDQQNRAGIGRALFGEGVPGSGYDRTQQIGTSLSVILARLETLRLWYQELLRCMLRLYAWFGGPDVQYLATDRATGFRTAFNRLSPVDVLNADHRLEVKFGSLSNLDKQQMGNLAAMLVQQGLVSHEYALSTLLQEPNPTAVMKQALRDQFYKDPALLRLAVLQEKAQDPADPFGAQLAQMIFLQEFQKFAIVQSQPPAQPGMGPNSPPLPGSGLPSQALPDELGMNAGMGPNGVALGPTQAGAGLQLPGLPL